jgi:hypothetical protein
MEEQIEKQQEPNMNAATHGLRTDNLIPGEDQAEFDAHKAAVYADLQPGTLEEELGEENDARHVEGETRRAL